MKEGMMVAALYSSFVSTQIDLRVGSMKLSHHVDAKLMSLRVPSCLKVGSTSEMGILYDQRLGFCDKEAVPDWRPDSRWNWVGV